MPVHHWCETNKGLFYHQHLILLLLLHLSVSFFFFSCATEELSTNLHTENLRTRQLLFSSWFEVSWSNILLHCHLVMLCQSKTANGFSLLLIWEWDSSCMYSVKVAAHVQKTNVWFHWYGCGYGFYSFKIWSLHVMSTDSSPNVKRETWCFTLVKFLRFQEHIFNEIVGD